MLSNLLTFEKNLLITLLNTEYFTLILEILAVLIIIQVVKNLIFR